MGRGTPCQHAAAAAGQTPGGTGSASAHRVPCSLPHLAAAAAVEMPAVRLFYFARCRIPQQQPAVHGDCRGEAQQQQRSVGAPLHVGSSGPVDRAKRGRIGLMVGWRALMQQRRAGPAGLAGSNSEPAPYLHCSHREPPWSPTPAPCPCMLTCQQVFAVGSEAHRGQRRVVAVSQAGLAAPCPCLPHAPARQTGGGGQREAGKEAGKRTGAATPAAHSGAERRPARRGKGHSRHRHHCSQPIAPPTPLTPGRQRSRRPPALPGRARR